MVTARAGITAAQRTCRMTCGIDDATRSCYATLVTTAIRWGHCKGSRHHHRVFWSRRKRTLHVPSTLVSAALGPSGFPRARGRVLEPRYPLILALVLALVIVQHSYADCNPKSGDGPIVWECDCGSNERTASSYARPQLPPRQSPQAQLQAQQQGQGASSALLVLPHCR